MLLMKSRKYILIADDEPEIRSILKDTMMDHLRDVTILDAADGGEAVRKAKMQQFDLIVMDLAMPKFDGHQAVLALNVLPQAYRPKNILVISGNSTREEVVDKFGSSVIFLEKPVAEAALVMVLQRVFKQTLTDRKDKFDVTLTNCFIKAASAVLSTMAKTKIVRESLNIRTPNEMSGDVSAILAVKSTLQRGSLSISFDKLGFLEVVEKMLGEKHTEITADIADAAAEICNQIFGVAKKELNEQGYDLQPSIPSVVTGDGHRLQHQSSGPCLCVKFRTERGGRFSIESVLEMAEAEPDQNVA